MASTTTFEPKLTTLRQRIRYIRCVLLEINRLEMSRRTGFPHASIANWERGVKPQDPVEVAQVYARVAEEPGLTAMWVLNGDLPLKEDTVCRLQGKAAVRTASRSHQALAGAA